MPFSGASTSSLRNESLLGLITTGPPEKSGGPVCFYGTNNSGSFKVVFVTPLFRPFVKNAIVKNNFMKSADPIFIEEFVKQCCIAGLSLEATATLLDNAQQKEMFENPVYREQFEKSAMLETIAKVGPKAFEGGKQISRMLIEAGEKILGTNTAQRALGHVATLEMDKSAFVKNAGPFGAVGKGVDWLGSKLFGGLSKGVTKGVPAVAGAASRGIMTGIKGIPGVAKALFGSIPRAATTAAVGTGAGMWLNKLHNDAEVGNALRALPNGIPGVSSGSSSGGGGSGGGRSPFDYINRTYSGASGADISGNSFGGGGSSGGNTSSHPSVAQLRHLKGQHASVLQLKTETAKQLQEATQSGNISVIPGLQTRMKQLDVEGNGYLGQMNKLTLNLKSDQENMQAAARDGLGAVHRVQPRFQADFDRLSKLREGPSTIGNFLPRLINGGENRITQKQQASADMVERLNAQQKLLEQARNTNYVPIE
jgi:hypothetical protein